jgi:hypothetical protein
MIARPATPGLYYDASVRLHESSARALLDAGCAGVFRYVPLPRNSASGDVTADEIQLLTGLGLEVGLVQHVRNPPWDPRQHRGGDDGACAADYAKLVGYHVDCHLWCDFEGSMTGTPSSAAIEYVTGWAAEVVAAGFRAGLYCGYDDPLSPVELYALHGVTSYWSDAGHRKVSTRGVAISQGPEMTIAGVRVDPDQVAPDLLGDLPLVCAADTSLGPVA